MGFRRRDLLKMKVPARWAGLVLPLFLTGCFFHHTHPTQNQQLAPSMPPPPPQTTPVELPASANTIPSEPTQNAKEQPQQSPKPHRHKPKPVNNDTQEAANVPPPSPQTGTVNAIGTLSSGDPADLRQQTQDSINSVERGLNNIGRSLSDSEQKTADHIREFLKQAREALTTGDVDGAHTLAAKAKVLLEELTK
jgi:outer membrane biosynthesis protein TonB